MKDSSSQKPRTRTDLERRARNRNEFFEQLTDAKTRTAASASKQILSQSLAREQDSRPAHSRGKTDGAETELDEPPKSTCVLASEREKKSRAQQHRGEPRIPGARI
jgi:hypothetical protein